MTDARARVEALAEQAMSAMDRAGFDLNGPGFHLGVAIIADCLLAYAEGAWQEKAKDAGWYEAGEACDDIAAAVWDLIKPVEWNSPGFPLSPTAFHDAILAYAATVRREENEACEEIVVDRSYYAETSRIADPLRMAAEMIRARRQPEGTSE